MTRILFDPFPLTQREPAGPGENDRRVVPGMSPRLADRIAEAMGVPPTAPGRVLANLQMELEEAEDDGHVCLPVSLLLNRVGLRLRIERDQLRRHLDRFAARGALVVDAWRGTEYAYDVERWKDERMTVEAIRHRIGQRFIRETPEIPTGLDQDQAQAVRQAFEQAVSVITGGPGRGKSHTLARIADTCQRLHLPLLLMATTGTAARRLDELMGEAGITPERPPGTVHRVLGLRARRRSVISPGPGLAVIDEASMLDLGTAAAALAVLPPRWHLLLVGDRDQLPSVGAGDVLADLLASLPAEAVTTLTTNHRSGGGDLSEAIDAILAGQAPASTEHFQLRELRAEDLAAQDRLTEIVVRSRDQLAHQHRVHPIEDVLLMTPRRTGGHPASADALNPELRARANPKAAGLPPNLLAIGDRVMNVDNDYRRDIMNGALGTVTDVVRTRAEHRVAVRFEDVSAVYSDEDIAHYLRLAYASTAHKAQGGQARCALVLLARAHGRMLYRRLVYTAVSRAQQTTLVLAEAGALEAAIANRREDRRHGLLGARIRGEL
jgi:exodeoxyribonuclease V alpha subunit